MGNNRGFIGIGAILAVVAVLAVGGIVYYAGTKNASLPGAIESSGRQNAIQSNNGQLSAQSTYEYANHGFSIELPKGFVPKEEQAEGGPAIVISMPVGSLSYVTDSAFWEKYNIPSYTYLGDKKIGQNTFKIYKYLGAFFYWFKQGNVGYEFGGTDSIGIEKLLKTFKFTGWPQ